MPRLPENRRPTDPGTILLRDFLEPIPLSQRALADAIDVSTNRVHSLIKGGRLAPDMALRLARYFGTSADLWMNLQVAVDLYEAREATDLGVIEPCPHVHD